MAIKIRCGGSARRSEHPQGMAGEGTGEEGEAGGDREEDRKIGKGEKIIE